MYQLKKCPFCGSEVVIKESKIFDQMNLRVVCPRCHIGTVPVSYDTMYWMYQGRTNVILTKEQALHDVCETWNHRILN